MYKIVLVDFLPQIGALTEITNDTSLLSLSPQYLLWIGLLLAEQTPLEPTTNKMIRKSDLDLNFDSGHLFWPAFYFVICLYVTKKDFIG